MERAAPSHASAAAAQAGALHTVAREGASCTQGLCTVLVALGSEIARSHDQFCCGGSERAISTHISAVQRTASYWKHSARDSGSLGHSAHSPMPCASVRQGCRLNHRDDHAITKRAAAGRQLL